MEEMSNQFQVYVRAVPNGLVWDMQGELNKNAELHVLSLLEWKETAPRYLILNFKEVTYVNNAGISIIIRLIRACNGKETVLFGYGINTLQEKLFRAVGITEYILFYPDEYCVIQRIDQL